MKKKSGLFKIGYKLALIVVGIAVISTMVISLFSFITFHNSSVSLISNHLASVSQSAAALIDPAQYREIMESGEPNEHHYWLSMYFTYKVEAHDLFHLHAGEIHPEYGFTGFVQALLHDFSIGLGEVSPAYQFPEEAFNAMTYGEVFLTDTFYALDYGWDISGAILLVAYAPVFDEYGNTIAIVSAVDIDESIYVHSREFVTRMIGISLFTMILLSVAPIIFARSHIGVPISKLSAATNAVVNGDLDYDLHRDEHVFANDELGLLADNFNDMITSIREKETAERAAYQSELKRGQAEAISNAMRQSTIYANKIQRNLLPSVALRRDAFSDFAVIWKPRDIVGGDIFWMKQFETGTVLCAADCTGHGIPGAFLTMLVISKLDAIVNADNCNDTAEILFLLDKSLSRALNVKDNSKLGNINDGCDIIAMFIANDNDITFSSGNTNIFVCNGKEVTRNRGQRLFIGENRLKSKDDVSTFFVPANPDDKFYLVSDGYFEQPGGKHGKSYGLSEFYDIIISNYEKNQGVVLGEIWLAFEKYRGNEPRVDDFSLIGFTTKRLGI